MITSNRLPVLVGRWVHHASSLVFCPLCSPPHVPRPSYPLILIVSSLVSRTRATCRPSVSLHAFGVSPLDDPHPIYRPAPRPHLHSHCASALELLTLSFPCTFSIFCSYSYAPTLVSYTPFLRRLIPCLYRFPFLLCYPLLFFRLRFRFRFTSIFNLNFKFRLSIFTRANEV
jgi:hypothetical protein